MPKKFYRSPVVVVLGHVDHGKTTLLDFIKKTNRAEKEIGGITQNIGAYEVELPFKDYYTNKITFIDTPGHEAFSKLRSRGADVADIAVLIIDAVDSVMPQTVESLSHIKSAKIPFIVAVNKIDLPSADIEKVKKNLLKENILVEGMGGDVPVAPISAKKGTGVSDLLETILLIASSLNLGYSPFNPVKAYIIESKKDKKGIIVSVIIKDGVLKIGDLIYADCCEAKIKALINDQGKQLKEVYPSTPVLLLGFKQIPEAGAQITNVKTIKPAVVKAASDFKQTDLVSMLGSEKPEKKKLKIILKSDSKGSQEALLSALSKNDTIEVVLASVGEINKSDIFLAKTVKAIIISFASNIDKNITALAEQEKVVIKTYQLIYQLLDELTEVSTLLIEKEKKEKQLKGEAKILANFIIEKEKVAGIKVYKGKLNLNDSIELYRNDNLIGKAKIVSLKIRAQNKEEIKKNEEAGMIFYPQLDFSMNDVIKSYSL